MAAPGKLGSCSWATTLFDDIDVYPRAECSLSLNCLGESLTGCPLNSHPVLREGLRHSRMWSPQRHQGTCPRSAPATKVSPDFLLKVNKSYLFFLTSLRQLRDYTGDQGGQIVESLEKQLDEVLPLPGALGISPTLPVPALGFSSLLKIMRGEAGEPLQELRAGAGLCLGRFPRHSVPLT